MLILVKSQGETVVGQFEGRLFGENKTLARPMRLETFIMQQPSKIHGQKQQTISAFRVVPLPCSEIFLDRVDYWGQVKEHEDVYQTYFKVLAAIEAKEKLEEEPAILAS